MKVVKGILKRIRKIKPHTLIILILLLMFSSYAWFVFVTRVSSGLAAHVSAWNVTFKVDDEEVREIAIDVGQIYPGMPNYEKVITIENHGEIDGEVSYEIKRMVILGTTYEVSDTVTSDDLIDMMENDFPFSLVLSVEGEEGNIIPVNTTRDVKISIVWPFDGDDEIDTKWGEDAYDYYKEHGTSSPAIHMDLVLKVDQKKTN